MEWTEVTVYTTHEGIEPVSGALAMLGIEEIRIEDAEEFEQFMEDSREYYDCIDDELLKLKDKDSTVTFYLHESPTGMDLLSSVEQALKDLKACCPAAGSLKIELKGVKEEDWANNWKKYFKPVNVSDFVTIKPTWEEYTPATSEEIVVEIDPGMAFGTGTHESTKMCIHLLEEFMEPGFTVADVGCGSGILSIVAAKFGAKSVMAIDSDEKAVEVARENVRLNRCEDIVDVKMGDLMSECRGKKYDIIVANIIADVIIRLNGGIANFLNKSGMYICSGIIDSRLEEVEASIKAQSILKIINVCEMGEWRAIACKYRG